MPVDGVECHELAKPPTDTDTKGQEPVPRTRDRIPDLCAPEPFQVNFELLSIALLNIELVIFLIFVMAPFTGIPQCANF